MYVNLYKNGKNKIKKIHRIVAENFIPNPENKPEVNHIDGNKQNNKVDNLEWVTKSENVKHRFSTLNQQPYRKYVDENIDWNTKEGINKYSRLYYQKNKEKILEYQRQWRNKKEQFSQAEYKIEKGE